MSRVPYYYSPALTGYDFGPQHPLKPERLTRTDELLAAYGAFEDGLIRIEPTPAGEADLVRVHDAAYVHAVADCSHGAGSTVERRWGLGPGDTPAFEGIYEASCLYSGASIGAAQAVVAGAPVAVSISGGLHHAHRSRAAGFCVFNDAALAIEVLRTRYGRVAYIDIDVHHGDGVQELFYMDDVVLTLSIHQSGRTLYPGTGEVSEAGTGAGLGCSVNLPLAPYTEGATWLDVLRTAGLPIVRGYAPGAIVLQAGADAHALDPLASLLLRAQEWLEAVRDVVDLGLPLVVLGGGGYNLTTVPRMWTAAVAVAAGLQLADEVPLRYRWRTEMPRLTDQFDVQLPSGAASSARAAAAATVDAVRASACWDRWVGDHA